MLNKPKFKSCFHIEILEPEGVFLLSEKDVFLLSGVFYQLLTPLIDGNHTVDEIVNLLQGQASAAEVYYAVMLMEQKGYIVEAHEDLPSAIAAFGETLNVDSKEAVSRLQATKVAVKNFGSVPIEKLLSNLKSLNIEVSEDGDIEVVLTDYYLQDGLDAFNQRALQSQRPWMLVKPVGTIIWIGPIFHPGKTGCWKCLAQRLRANRPVEKFIQKRKGISTPLTKSCSILPSTLQTGFNLAATEIAKWIIQGENKQLEGKLVTLDTISLETQKHSLVQRPQCPCCGKPEYWLDREPAPIVLKSWKKTVDTDGGYRCFSPEKTLKKYEHHISPITGVVRGLMKISQVDNSLLHTYIAGHNFASMFDDLYFLRQNIRGRSAGKGKTDIQSRASGFCEAIERYSGVFHGEEIRHKSTYQEMGDVAIHPNNCLNFSQKQYQSRKEWNVKSDISQRIPEPFDETREIEWTPVWSLTHQVFKYLPTAYCYYGYPNHEKPDCWADSNGNAAGNTLEEAILQGFIELVERDSVALWWYNRLRKPAVNLDSFDEPYFQALQDYYQTISRELWVLDLTSDFNIPVFVAISRRTDREIEDIVFGFGAHFNPHIAVLRAVTEMNQSLPSVSEVNPDGSTRYPLFAQSAVDWWKKVTIKNQVYLVPELNATPKKCSDYPHFWKEDLLEDVMACLDLVKEKGMEMLVLDQTRPDVGLNVVKVIVPGIRHFWRRLGPGRLYDVPVKLGWLKKPNSENELNPLSMFF